MTVDESALRRSPRKVGHQLSRIESLPPCVPPASSRLSGTGALSVKARRSEIHVADLLLDQYLDQWLDLAVKPRLKPKTHTDYSSLLSRYIRPILGRKRIGNIAPLDLRAIYQGMAHRGLSPRTISYTHAVVRAAFGQAIQWRMIAHNPAEGLALPARAGSAVRSLRLEEAKRFIQAALKTRYTESSMPSGSQQAVARANT